MATWKCQVCGWENAGKWEECAKCKSKKNPTPEDIYRLALAKQRAAEFMISTTPTLEGNKIVKYYGVISSVIVLGTGFFSELGAGIADLVGGSAVGYQKKLDDSTRAVLKSLSDKALARSQEINALVGLSLDYSVTEKNMMILCGTATAVRYEKIES
ncbi:MAG: heavy metal-binding domain-containing protein [Bellilinea sp.]